MSDGDPVAAVVRKHAAAGRRATPELRIWMGVIAVLAVLPHVPGLDSDFGRSLLSQMGIAVVFALSYNVLFGQTGLLSFGHAVYFGLGGYVAIQVMRAINHGQGPARAAQVRERGGGRGKQTVRRRVEFRARAVRGAHADAGIARAAARLLRRAGGRQDSRPCRGYGDA